MGGVAWLFLSSAEIRADFNADLNNEMFWSIAKEPIKHVWLIKCA